MIHVIETNYLMPSYQKKKARQKERLEEISNLIRTAAMDDKDNITIKIYDYEEYFILSALKENGFTVIKLPDTMEYTEISNIKTYRTSYNISWA